MTLGLHFLGFLMEVLMIRPSPGPACCDVSMAPPDALSKGVGDQVVKSTMLKRPNMVNLSDLFQFSLVSTLHGEKSIWRPVR